MGPKRDLVRPFVEAMRAAGLKVGFYYSFANRYHPDYPGAYNRDRPAAWRDEESRQRFVRHVAAQLEGLMTEYGEIDILWYDGCFPVPTDGGSVNMRIKQVQPNILINDRNGRPFDFHCCEQACGSGTGLGGLYHPERKLGCHAGDDNWKNARQVVRMLTETASGGGNLLLNIGPVANAPRPHC